MINSKEAAELLQELVSISSPYFREDEIMDYVLGWFGERGMKAELHRYYEANVTGFRGKNVILCLDGGEPGPHICLNGHLDTVKLCGGWTRNPGGELVTADSGGAAAVAAGTDEAAAVAVNSGGAAGTGAATNAGDLLYGVGALDMKSGCAANMMALEEFYREHKTFRGKISASFVSVEEGPCGIGTNALIEEGYMDGVDFSIITEPSAGFTGKPFPDLCLGARGGYGLEIELMGKSTHAATPEKGISAAADAAKVICQLEGIHYEEDPCLGRGTACVVAVECDGGSCSVPDRAVIKMFWHIVRGEDMGTIQAELEAAIARAGIRCSHRIAFREGPSPDSKGFMPYVTPEADPMVQEFMGSVEAICGKRPSVSYFQSIGDFNYLGSRLGAPAVIFGADGGNFHGSDEYVRLDTVAKTAEVVYDFLVRTLAAR